MNDEISKKLVSTIEAATKAGYMKGITDATEVVIQFVEKNYTLVPQESIIALADALEELVNKVEDGTFSVDNMLEEARNE